MNYSFLTIIDQKSLEIDRVADFIWEHPEVGYNEYMSSEALIQLLENESFVIEKNIAGIPTAFKARYGSGSPVLGFIGEYDALMGMNQIANETVKQGDGNKNGHGCGHNLLGVGSAAAAIATKEYLSQSKKSGTIIFIGCPAEEGGSGKTFMARGGAFNELDIALYWHPDTENYVRPYRNLANAVTVFEFKGKAAHAASNPHLGRSALDAAELMNVGVQFLREHVPNESRIHYAFLSTGGASPNVVHPSASLRYMIRSPQMSEVTEITERVKRIAQGAALMTDTEVDWHEESGSSNMILNAELMKVLQSSLETIEVPELTETEIQFGREMMMSGLKEYDETDIEKPYHMGIKPLDLTEPLKYTSNDLSDVSWICPTVQLYAACFVHGTTNHTWQLTSQGKTSAGHKMMRYAGKVLALTAAKLFESPMLISKAKNELDNRLGTNQYNCPIPDSINAPPFSLYVQEDMLSAME